MNTKIYYNIQVEENEKTEQIDFQMEYDENENVDGYSFNPTSGWTGYTEFTQGWSEQDEDLNELLRAIEDYATSMELDFLIADTKKEDIGKTYERDYYCDRYVHENKEYHFTVTIEDVEEGDEE